MAWLQEKKQVGKEITEALYENGMIKTWWRDKSEGWKLVSGIWSPFYINLRPIASYPNSREILTKVGTVMGDMIKEECPEVNKIVGIANAGIPIATAITFTSGIPMCYTRKLEGVKNIEQLESKIKEYGEHSLVEGELNNGDVISLVDDLVTRFDSKYIGERQVEYEAEKRNISVTCKHVNVLLDREQGASERAKELGMSLHSLIPFKSEGLWWLRDKLAET
jgi:orotate phosphoribosyltransferase